MSKTPLSSEASPLRLASLVVTDELLGGGGFAKVYRGVATFVVDGPVGVKGGASALRASPSRSRTLKGR